MSDTCVVIVNRPLDVVALHGNHDGIHAEITNNVQNIGVINSRCNSALVFSAAQGVAGAKGDKGDPGSAVITVTATQPIGGGRIVAAVNGEYVYASNIIPSHIHLIIGVSVSAANTMQQLEIRTAGLMQDSTWSWVENMPIYLSQNGILTQSPPSTGFISVIAFALSPTTIFIKQPLSINLV